MCWDNLDSSHAGYTYRHDTFSHSSYIDRLFIIENIILYIKLLHIIDIDSNLSDHCPLLRIIQIPDLNLILILCAHNQKHMRMLNGELWNAYCCQIYKRLTYDF